MSIFEIFTLLDIPRSDGGIVKYFRTAATQIVKLKNAYKSACNSYQCSQ